MSSWDEGVNANDLERKKIKFQMDNYAKVERRRLI